MRRTRRSLGLRHDAHQSLGPARACAGPGTAGQSQELCCALPLAAPWAAAAVMPVVLPLAHVDNAVPLSSCCKVGRVTFWGHALGQATLGCPCRSCTAIAGTV